MRVSTAFPSKYIAAPDLQGREVTINISRVVMEEVDRDKPHKPVIYFQGTEKGMVLNKTNAGNIALIYGDEMDAWSGHPITLFTCWVDFQGKSVEAIRVKPVVQQSVAQKPSEFAAETTAQTQDLDNQALSGGGGGLDDEIPF